jgi:DNA-binding IclR family transcriptional regulator
MNTPVALCDTRDRTMKQIGRPRVRAIMRATEILTALGDGDARLVELAERLTLHKTTVSRLLETLRAAGMVARDDTGHYRLGPSVLVLLGGLLSRYREIVDVLREPLHRVWKQTGETIGAHIRVGSTRVCIAEIEGSQHISYRAGVGSRAPLHRGAPSKVLLAWVPPKEQAAIVRALCARAPRSTVNELKAQLLEIKHQGYAISRGEFIPGACAVAVPVFDTAGTVAAAVSVYGPDSRFTSSVIEKHRAVLLHEIRGLATIPEHLTYLNGASAKSYPEDKRTLYGTHGE